MKLTIGDLRNLIPDILDLRDERRLLESELERHLIEDWGYSSFTAQEDTRAVLTELLGKGILSTGATVKKIGGGTLYIPDPKQWIAVNRYSPSFNHVKTSNEMKAYLGDIERSLDGKKYLYKYTKISKVQELLNTHRWLVGHPYFLNDKYEYNAFGGDPYWDGKFVSCFMRENSEAVSMWSMYAQPWEDAVRIGIPANTFKKWIRSITRIYDSDGNVINKTFRIYYADVLYVPEDTAAPISRGSMKNDLYRDYLDPEMIGYVKDEAWSYEKEVRLHIDVPGLQKERIYVHFPQEIIDSIEIMTGPKAEGITIPGMTVKESRFKDLLSWVYCDDCRYKKEVEEKRKAELEEALSGL